MPLSFTALTLIRLLWKAEIRLPAENDSTDFYESKVFEGMTIRVASEFPSRKWHAVCVMADQCKHDETGIGVIATKITKCLRR